MDLRRGEVARKSSHHKCIVSVCFCRVVLLPFRVEGDGRCDGRLQLCVQCENTTSRVTKVLSEVIPGTVLQSDRPLFASDPNPGVVAPTNGSPGQCHRTPRKVSPQVPHRTVPCLPWIPQVDFWGPFASSRNTYSEEYFQVSQSTHRNWYWYLYLPVGMNEWNSLFL